MRHHYVPAFLTGAAAHIQCGWDMSRMRKLHLSRSSLFLLLVDGSLGKKGWRAQQTSTIQFWTVAGKIIKSHAFEFVA